jgi:hypothetical protein
MTDEREFVCGEDYYPLLPNATYEAQCTKYDSKFVLGKTRKLFLNFKIVEPGEHLGKELFMAFNMPYDRKIRVGSKYYKAWVKLNDGRKPTRNAKMSPRLFLNKVCRIRTRTVIHKYNEKDEMPESFRYSVVDEIIGVMPGEGHNWLCLSGAPERRDRAGHKRNQTDKS